MLQADPTLSVAQRVDAACDRFESEWKAGGRPNIDNYVAAAPASDQEELRKALVAVARELASEANVDTSVTHTSAGIQDRCGAVETVAHAAEQPPKAIGRFEIRGVLGSGAFGKVYRAFDARLGREVALKVPLELAVKTDNERAQFLREARAAATVSHPNVCQVHEVGEYEGRPYIVMALIPGRSLAEVIKTQQRPLPERQAALIVRKIAVALAAAHANGVVHRDLKPANVMFDHKRKDVVVMDFGLARGPRFDDASATQSGVIMGTPAYMSPEQARGGSKDVGPATDIFSLGTILYELLAGCRPFSGTATEVIGQILHVDPDSPSQRRPGIDPRLDAVCMKAMAKDPAGRFSTMAEFAKALDVVLRARVSGVKPGDTARAEETRREGDVASDKSNLSDLFAALSAERKQVLGETAAALDAAIARHRSPRSLIVLVGLLFIGILTLGAIAFYTRSDTVKVTIELTDIDLRDNTLQFFLDEEPISAEALASPVELMPGEHVLVAKRGDQIVRRLLLTVTGGRSPGIRVRNITPPDPANPNIVWTPLIQSADDLVPGETASANGDGQFVGFNAGILELRGARAAFHPKFAGRNYILRAKILHFSAGKNIMFYVRRQRGIFGGYGAYFNNQDPGLDWPAYGIGKSAPNMPWQDLGATMQRVTDSFPVEFAVAAYHGDIIIYVNGKRVLKHTDRDSAEGSVLITLTEQGQALLSEVQVCLLDGTDLKPDDIFPQKDDAKARRLLAPEFLTAETKKGNLLRNGSFEHSDTSMWTGDSWRRRTAWRFTQGEGHDGKRILVIDSPENDNVSVAQAVKVRPGRRYLLSGWVKTDRVRSHERRTSGAYIYVPGGHELQNTNVEGTTGWSYQAFVFRSGTRDSVTVSARLGGFASTASGTASFDDMCLIELPDEAAAPAEGN